MRELKFRAWNTNWKEYEYGCYDVEPSPDYIFEQYTGLKDKNGKEIYEGDILLGYYEDFGMPASNKKHYEVKWVERSTGYEPFIDYDIECERFFSIETCEVIGNIHENPELLEI